MRYQSGIFEHRQVFGDQWLGDAGVSGKSVHAVFSAREALEQSAAGRIAERSEYGIVIRSHGRTITAGLWLGTAIGARFGPLPNGLARCDTAHTARN
jgi:hypothetical protein